MRLKRLSKSYVLRPFLFLKEGRPEVITTNKFQTGSFMHNLRLFFIKTAIIFMAIYLCIILPLSKAVEHGFSGFDQVLTKPSTKLILIGLISNPEVLYQIASEELSKGNLDKANNFLLAAIGVIESHQASVAYKAKFYELEKRIASARKVNMK